MVIPALECFYGKAHFAVAILNTGGDGLLLTARTGSDNADAAQTSPAGTSGPTIGSG